MLRCSQCWMKLYVLQHCSIASRLQHTCMDETHIACLYFLRGRGSPGSRPSCIWGPRSLSHHERVCMLQQPQSGRVEARQGQARGTAEAPQAQPPLGRRAQVLCGGRRLAVAPHGSQRPRAMCLPRGYEGILVGPAGMQVVSVDEASVHIHAAQQVSGRACLSSVHAVRLPAHPGNEPACLQLGHAVTCLLHAYNLDCC